MTPDELDSLIASGFQQKKSEWVTISSELATPEGAMDLAKKFESLSEHERSKLAAVARRRLKTDGSIYAELAVLAVCPLADARRVRGQIGEWAQPVIIKILTDRRPAWLDDWVAAKLSRQWPDLEWPVLHALIKSSACKKPTGAGYVQLFVGLSGFAWDEPGRRPLSEVLLAEPDLLDDVWRLFEHETFQVTAQFRQPESEEMETWAQAIKKLSKLGKLDRGRVLDATLQALGNDFSNNALTGHIRFWEFMEPTAKEVAARVDRLLGLLPQRVSHVVSFALEQISSIEQHSRQNAEQFIAAAKSVFQLKPKSQPMAALSLAVKMTERDAGLIPEAIDLAIEALSHSAADVQKRASELLEKWRPRMHTDHLAEIRQRSEHVAASVRGRLEKLAAASPADSGEKTSETRRGEDKPAAGWSVANQPEDAAPKADVAHGADQLDPHWRTLAGVDEAIQAARATLPGGTVVQHSRCARPDRCRTDQADRDCGRTD